MNPPAPVSPRDEVREERTLAVAGATTAATLAVLAAALGALLLLVVACVSPDYEVPQADDWAYVEALRQSVAKGEVVDLGWNDPTFVAQLGWGWMFAAAFGDSYETLRASTLVLGWFGAIAFCAILLRCGVPRVAAFAGACLLLLHPIGLVASYSFNSDVPYLALATIATALLLKALADRSLALLALAGVAAAASFLVRQQGALLVAAAALWIVTRRPDPLGKRFGAALVFGIPTAIALVAHAIWLQSVRQGSVVPRFGSFASGFDPMQLAWIGIDLFATATNLGIAVAPIVLPWFVLRIARRAPSSGPASRGGGRPALVVGALFVVGSAVLMAFQPAWLRGWPYGGCYFTRTGPLAPDATTTAALGPGWLWHAATVLVVPCGAWLACALVAALRPAAVRDRGDEETRLVVLLGLGQLAPTFLFQSFYDRYLMVALPGVLLVALRSLPNTRLARGLVLPSVLVAGALSIEWLRSYVDRSKARWEVAQESVAAGFAANEVQVGFEWEGTHLFHEAKEKLGIALPYRDWSRGSPWAPLLDFKVDLVEQRRAVPAAIATRRYRPFLELAPRFVCAVTRQRETDAGAGAHRPR